MTIPDDLVAAMRAYLGALHANADNAFDESDRQFLTLLKAGRHAGLDVLLVAAFTIAARHRFAPVWNNPQVIRYVAEIRSEAPEMASLLSPEAAENQLRIALGAEIPAHPDMEARIRAQIILLAALTVDYTDTELETLMNDANRASDCAARRLLVIGPVAFLEPAPPTNAFSGNTTITISSERYANRAGKPLAAVARGTVPRRWW